LVVDATRYGFRIRACRNKRGWTQAELALRLGSVTRSAVAQWEGGWTEPSKVNIQTLARVFNIPIAEMLPDFDRGVGSTVHPGVARHNIAIAPPRFEGALLREAVELGIDVAAELSPHLRAVIRLKRGDRWLEENRAALGEANGFLDPLGLWSDGKRLF
jgi:transcriptional regulator with XRE-family HTH domain